MTQTHIVLVIVTIIGIIQAIGLTEPDEPMPSGMMYVLIVIYLGLLFWGVAI